MPAGDRQGGLVVQKKRFQVRVGVIFASLVMTVLGSGWRELFQPLTDVVNEPALVVVDVDARR